MCRSVKIPYQSVTSGGADDTSFCFIHWPSFGDVVISDALLEKEWDMQEGKTFYLKHCEICHGLEGMGDGYTHFDSPIADLTESRIQKNPIKNSGKVFTRVFRIPRWACGSLCCRMRKLRLSWDIFVHWLKRTDHSFSQKGFLLH